MMQDSSDMEAERNPSQSDLSVLFLDVQRSSPGFEESECPPQYSRPVCLLSSSSCLCLCVAQGSEP